MVAAIGGEVQPLTCPPQISGRGRGPLLQGGQGSPRPLPAFPTPRPTE